MGIRKNMRVAFQPVRTNCLFLKESQNIDPTVTAIQSSVSARPTISFNSPQL